jgi:beta-lactamase class A
LGTPQRRHTINNRAARGVLTATTVVAVGLGAAGTAVADPQGSTGSTAVGSLPTRNTDDLRAQLTALIDEAGRDGITMSASVKPMDGHATGQQLNVGTGDRYKSASVIKLTILATLLHQVDEGKASLATTVTLNGDEDNIVAGSGELRNRDFPLQISVAELAKLMIQVSDNSATNVLIDQVGGFSVVNDYMASLGYRSFHLGRKMIHPADPPEGENYLTAAEVTDLLARVSEGGILSQFSRDFYIGLMRGQTVDTKFGAVIPRIFLANKTGEIGDASHDSGYILIPGRQLAVAVTTSFEDGRPEADADAYVQRAGTLVYDQAAWW